MAWASACFFALAAFVPAVVMVEGPVTVVVPVPQKVRLSKVVLLQLEGVLVRRNAAAVWNVFWDMPSADSQTSVDNVHFVGYVTWLANAATRAPQAANFTLELPHAAVAVLRRHETMRLTFVPTRKLPEGGVTINTLRLE